MPDGSNLKNDVSQVRDAAKRLMDDEIASKPGQAERGAQADVLAGQLHSLRPAVDAAPVAERSTLDDLWREAQRALIFVSAMAGSAKPSTAPSDPTAIAQQLNNEAFVLGQQAAAKTGDRAARETHARELLEQIDQELAKPHGQEPQIQRFLSDAMLDAMFVLQGGEGPSSIRLGHFLQNQSKAQ